METMYTYILEEEKCFNDIINKRKDSLKKLNDLLNAKRDKLKRIVFLATGSSVNALNCSKNYIEELLKVSVDIQMPGMYCSYNKWIDKDEIIIAISQSGKSTSTINAVKKAKVLGAEDIAVLTSDINSPICNYCDISVDINCGIENVGYVTKGFSATVLTLLLFALEGALTLGKISIERYENELNELNEVIKQVNSTISLTNEWYENNKEEFLKAKRIKTVGYGAGVGIAMESNTKIAETVRVPISSFELEEYTHGPYLELKDNHFMFFIQTKGCQEERLEKLISYCKRYTKFCYKITYEKERESRRDLNLNIECNEFFSTLLLVVPIQILSYRLAEDLGIDLSEKIYTDFHLCLESKLI